MLAGGGSKVIVQKSNCSPKGTKKEKEKKKGVGGGGLTILSGGEKKGHVVGTSTPSGRGFMACEGGNGGRVRAKKRGWHGDEGKVRIRGGRQSRQ